MISIRRRQIPKHIQKATRLIIVFELEIDLEMREQDAHLATLVAPSSGPRMFRREVYWLSSVCVGDGSCQFRRSVLDEAEVAVGTIKIENCFVEKLFSIRGKGDQGPGNRSLTWLIMLRAHNVAWELGERWNKARCDQEQLRIWNGTHEIRYSL